MGNAVFRAIHNAKMTEKDDFSKMKYNTEFLKQRPLSQRNSVPEMLTFFCRGF